MAKLTLDVDELTMQIIRARSKRHHVPAEMCASQMLKIAALRSFSVMAKPMGVEINSAHGFETEEEGASEEHL